MKILAFSDLHLDVTAAEQILAVSNDADLVVGVGDFAERREGLEDYMGLFEPISDKSIFVPGNCETEDQLRQVTSVKVLNGESFWVSGVSISALGCAVPPMPMLTWGSFDMTEEEAAGVLESLAPCELLLSHSPPYGVVDRLDVETAEFLGLQEGRLMGSKSLRSYIEKEQPSLCLCGHIHACWGQEGLIGNTRVVNLGPTPNWFEL